ncbi:amidase domain-containing protein [Paenisporosarcina sp. NPDC076898]|uniref:amidase domain-containing protein n=1 Tax=unclassified Paenisporosarcina TaxID=2642018 RepID=UPI003D05D8CE
MYNRQAAVDYANRWWDSNNPAFPVFDVDCTNYISQCLLAGGAPMRSYPNRNKGWWVRGGTWSFSWSTSHALRWYLDTSTTGLQAVKVANASDLKLGDVISYDFQGDGRFDHTTIVTGFNEIGEPLVNAHTVSARQRDWRYTTSPAYTDDARYIFFHIKDSFT